MLIHKVIKRLNLDECFVIIVRDEGEILYILQESEIYNLC